MRFVNVKTAVKDDVVGCFEKIEELRQKAEQEIKEYQKMLQQAQSTLQKLAEVASETSEHMASDLEVSAPKRRGRKPGVKLNGRRRGRKAQAKVQVKASATKRGAKRGRRAKAENGISLKQYVFDIGSRPAAAMKKMFPEYPADAKGATVGEIRDIIEKEGKWSTSGEIGPQIHNALYHLREDKKMTRNEKDRRYYVVGSAKLED
jgi:hypothetical protein